MTTPLDDLRRVVGAGPSGHPEERDAAILVCWNVAVFIASPEGAGSVGEGDHPL